MKKFLLPFLLCCAALAAYYNSFNGPFMFDGLVSIKNDTLIRHLWPLGRLIHGTSRPLVRLSFALNYFFNRLDVFGYHLVNLFIHAFSSLALFGLIRRTMRAPKLSLAKRYSPDAIAFATALLWVVHPLETESVTYIFQRSESLMGLFYLLTMYAAARGLGSATRARGWFTASCLFCAAGMASKTVMVTAPLLALAYDRIFWARSWREISKKRLWFYLGLAASWSIFAFIAMSPNESRYTAGFGIKYATPLEYVRTQPGVILHYLKLAFWPYGLALDNGWPFALKLSSGIMPFVSILALLCATFWALKRYPAPGFLGLWFFLILAPTSSFFPLADPVFEHRMYLPLAAVILGAVLLCGDVTKKLVTGARLRILILSGLLAVSSTFLCARTIRRNSVYRSRAAIWKDVVAKRPDNLRGHDILADILTARGELRNALEQHQEVLRLRTFGPVADDKNPAAVQYNLALESDKEGDLDTAIVRYRQALALDPGLLEARNNLAVALARKNKFQKALTQLFQALLEDSDNEQLKANMQEVLECISLASRISPGPSDTPAVL